MLEALEMLWQQYSDLLLTVSGKILLVLLILYVCSVISRLIRRAFRKANYRLGAIDPLVVSLISSTLGYLVFVIGILIILDMFGFNTTSIIALLGAAGLAIGLALRDTLSNIAAGIMLLFLRPYRIDDFIECGGISGRVKEIGLFTTILQARDGLFVSIPNSRLWGQPLINFTRNGRRRMEINIGISYSDSIETAIEALLNIARQHPDVMEDPAPQAFVTEIADSAVNLQLRAWAPVDVFWETSWALTRSAKEAIEAAGLTIPFPQRTISMNPPVAELNPVEPAENRR
ncbi:mechanosensitive ion channel MscS [Methylophaga lonarensis MPL]|uniref:Small-conductance mechanosensitive channel n=1 Tax=Methylophaga lonarensis MPL TaxID=1286106 RepID=M7PSI8_9GAMM|nr:mechanosensitive ion channel family protein [Methylophaga lonarensis]EMR13409.1 mechanosensitive ion channel MscS [Methylophaga lonarensis MPL]